MRICFITPSLEKGGMERVLVELSNFGVQHGHHIYILAILPDREIAYPIDEKVSYITPSYSYSEGISFKVKSMFFLYNKIKEIAPDACLSFSETFNPLAILAAKAAGIKIYISDRSNPLKKVGTLKNVIKKVLYPMASGMIAQTVFAQRIFEKRKLNRNIVTIPNPLRQVTNESMKLDGEGGGKKVIVSVGRLIPSKNFDQLIHIFSKVSNEKWELWILGEGNERASLTDLAEKLNLKDRVKLFGQVDHVDEYLSQADIFAFTSLSEGFPNALSEAMATPLACIAFDCPAGPADIIADGINGYLVPLYNEQLYVDKLQKMMHSPELRREFSLQAYKNKDKFSQEHTSERYFNFILNI